VASAPLFTVFTATYNRAHTIHRVFDSLCAQTFRDFEWLVVDDGSTDNTFELMETWRRSAEFPIRYFKQENSGKHIAHNLGAREARGQFFLPLDSDDACVPEALERFAHHWNSIPAAERVQFSGVGGLCRNQHGEIVGDRFPSDPFDCSWRDICYVHRIRGEKWGITLTALVRQFPFPDLAGSNFVPEGMVWLEIARTHKIRCVNEILRIYYVDDSKTGPTLTKQSEDNASGLLYYYTWLLNNDLEYFFRSPGPFLKAALMLPIVGRLSAQSFRSVLRSLKKVPARLLVLSLFPLSSLFFRSRKNRAVMDVS